MKRDSHLNLFYSYNSDSELIEDNLTRALMVSLGLLSGESRDAILTALFRAHVKEALLKRLPESFAEAEFSLQGKMDRAALTSYKRRFVVTLTTLRYDLKDAGIESSHMVVRDLLALPSSRPDGWIYASPDEYCLLFEVKVGDDLPPKN